MRYRREEEDGDYSFGQGDNTFLVNSPECVAQAVKTRFHLWQGQWFLDTGEGTPYMRSIIGKHDDAVVMLSVRDRISATKGVKEITSMQIDTNQTTRKIVVSATIDTIYGMTSIKGV